VPFTVYSYENKVSVRQLPGVATGVRVGFSSINL